MNNNIKLKDVLNVIEQWRFIAVMEELNGANVGAYSSGSFNDFIDSQTFNNLSNTSQDFLYSIYNALEENARQLQAGAVLK